MAGEFIHEMSQRAENSLKHPILLACFIEKSDEDIYIVTIHHSKRLLE
jgi:hypothetical protein